MSYASKIPQYVFFGTPNFAAIVLERLIAAGFPPACVVCNPDKPVGRKKVITPPPAKLVAQKNGIRVWQPEKLSAEGVHQRSILLRRRSASGGEAVSYKSEVGEVDFAVVAAYSKIIPKNIIEIPAMGVIGVHPSLLPKHRGASPIQSTILHGDEETGVTLFLIDEKVDHGPILAQARINSHGSWVMYIELQKKLAELAGDLLIETFPKFLTGEIVPRAQNESEATYTKKFSSEDAYIPPDDLALAISGEDQNMAELIERKIRALNPEPGVWTMKNEKRTKLLEAEIQGGKLRLKKVQIEGKKSQNINML